MEISCKRHGWLTFAWQAVSWSLAILVLDHLWQGHVASPLFSLGLELVLEERAIFDLARFVLTNLDRLREEVGIPSSDEITMVAITCQQKLV